MRHAPLPRRAVLAGGLAASAAPVRAQAYPDRPVRLIVGFPPGGGTDIMARLIAATLSPRLGQPGETSRFPVVVENRPGASATLAAAAAAAAPPDGHTLLYADAAILIFNEALFERLPYRSEDFRPVVAVALTDLFLCVRREASYANVGQWLARARTEAVDCATPGAGTPHHLALARLTREAGLRVNHVPYRGAAQALTDLVAGRLDSVVLDGGSASGMMRSGDIRALAMCSAERSPLAPDVPTFRESGVPDFSVVAPTGIVVHRMTPEPIVARLSQELAAVMQDPALNARMRENSSNRTDSDPDLFARRIAEQRALWVPLIRSMGVKAD